MFVWHPNCDKADHLKHLFSGDDSPAGHDWNSCIGSFSHVSLSCSLMLNEPGSWRAQVN